MRATLLLLSLAVLAVAAPFAQDEPEAPDAESSTLPEPVPTTSIAIPDPTLPVPESTSLNIPVTATTAVATDVPSLTSSSRSRTKRPPHSEPVPIFSKSCDCPNLATMAYPCWATDALQRCNFEELHSFVCWTSANYGCPTPTRSCESLFSPTPITGKNPCEIGPGGAEPMITGAPARRWQDMVAKL